MLCRLQEDITSFTKERDKIQQKLEKFIIYQQYLEKVLENAEEVSNTFFK